MCCPYYVTVTIAIAIVGWASSWSYQEIWLPHKGLITVLCGDWGYRLVAKNISLTIIADFQNIRSRLKIRNKYLKIS